LQRARLWQGLYGGFRPWWNEGHVRQGSRLLWWGHAVECCNVQGSCTWRASLWCHRARPWVAATAFGEATHAAAGAWANATGNGWSRRSVWAWSWACTMSRAFCRPTAIANSSFSGKSHREHCAGIFETRRRHCQQQTDCHAVSHCRSRQAGGDAARSSSGESHPADSWGVQGPGCWSSASASGWATATWSSATGWLSFGRGSTVHTRFAWSS